MSSFLTDPRTHVVDSLPLTLLFSGQCGFFGSWFLEDMVEEAGVSIVRAALPRMCTRRQGLLVC